MPGAFQTTRRSRWSVFSLLWKTAASIVIVSVAIVLLLRWVPPPTSAFMLKHRLSGAVVDYRWTPMDRISPHAALAVIASEDQNFFDHWGLDLKAIADAIQDNRTRSRPRGASTISQQVVKNLFLWSGRSYLRKGIEVYFTLFMELLWPKARILEVYLNIAEMGEGVFGAEAAAQRYFGVGADRLSVRQAALIAAALPNPKERNPGRPSGYLSERAAQIAHGVETLRVEGAECLGLK